jgi:hypothetical protein
MRREGREWFLVSSLSLAMQHFHQASRGSNRIYLDTKARNFRSGQSNSLQNVDFLKSPVWLTRIGCLIRRYFIGTKLRFVTIAADGNSYAIREAYSACNYCWNASQRL